MVVNDEDQPVEVQPGWDRNTHHHGFIVSAARACRPLESASRLSSDIDATRGVLG